MFKCFFLSLILTYEKHTKDRKNRKYQMQNKLKPKTHTNKSFFFFSRIFGLQKSNYGGNIYIIQHCDSGIISLYYKFIYVLFIKIHQYYFSQLKKVSVDTLFFSNINGYKNKS